MDTAKHHYHAYMLRLWRAGACDDGVRASLQAVSSAEVQHFGCLADLIAYLEQVTGAPKNLPETDCTSRPFGKR